MKGYTRITKEEYKTPIPEEKKSKDLWSLLNPGNDDLELAGHKLKNAKFTYWERTSEDGTISRYCKFEYCRSLKCKICNTWKEITKDAYEEACNRGKNNDSRFKGIFKLIDCNTIPDLRLVGHLAKKTEWRYFIRTLDGVVQRRLYCCTFECPACQRTKCIKFPQNSGKT